MGPLNYSGSQSDFMSPPSRIEFVKNVLIRHVRGLFQIRESPLPPNHVGRPRWLGIISQQEFLFLIKHQIIVLAPNNPRKIAPQENPYAIDRLSVLHKGWSKGHCTIENDFSGPNFSLWQRIAKCCWQHIATLVERVDNWRTCVPPIPPTVGHSEGNFC